jgi:peptidoglycan DL-endopeptidase CwlO
MGAHRARHRGAPGTPGTDQHRTVSELLAQAAEYQPPPRRLPQTALATPAFAAGPTATRAVPPPARVPSSTPARPSYPPLPPAPRASRPIRSPRAMPAPRSRHGVPAPRSPRSAFAVVAASAVGAGTAAASMSGAFAAVPNAPARDLGDTQSFSRPAVQSADLDTTSGPVTGGAFHAASASLVSSVPEAAPATATVMAADLHQTDARQIADLSRAVDLDRAQSAALAATRAAQAVQSALVNKVSSLTGVTPLFDASSPVAAKALTTAIGKMGVPYVWGAVGPNAFDCSGLVMWSYRKQGINLPRTAAQQSQVGTPVSRSQLRAGDLVFFYSPVSHVGIYLGNNKILNASESGQPVKVSSMAHMPFHNARRIT